jgi:predicted amidohydrolase YtcJ
MCWISVRQDCKIFRIYRIDLENPANHVNPAAGWFPNERISIEEAIRAYTYNTAYANFEEKSKGSIERGKLADLTVLSKNLLTVAPKDFLTTDVLYTIVGGKVVYQN